jgi:hypothetical protein
MENLSRGAVAEFCLGRLLWEMEEASAVAPLPAGVLPWPSDEVCLCGRSLAPAMYCCDQTAPFSMKLYPDVGPEFSLMRPCCGQLLRGFQCDACSRVFSWEAGVREVH